VSPDHRNKRRQIGKLHVAGRCRRASQQSTLQLYMATLVAIMPRRVALTLGLMVCLRLTEGVGLLMLVPLPLWLAAFFAGITLRYSGALRHYWEPLRVHPALATPAWPMPVLRLHW
jgi:hypothetical protein